MDQRDNCKHNPTNGAVPALCVNASLESTCQGKSGKWSFTFPPLECTVQKHPLFNSFFGLATDKLIDPLGSYWKDVVAARLDCVISRVTHTSWHGAHYARATKTLCCRIMILGGGGRCLF